MLWDEVAKSTNDLEDRISRILRIVLSLSIVILVLLIGVALWISKRIAALVVRPLNALFAFFLELNANFNTHSSTEEIRNAYTNVKKLLGALENGNHAYYRGEYNLAIEVFDKIEKLMIKAENRRGLGIVLNNKANVMRKNPMIPEEEVEKL